jgi:polyisoprenoid-binding protein YceI
MTSAGEGTQDLSGYAGSWTLDTSLTSVKFRTKAMWIIPVTGTMKALKGTASLDHAGAITATVELDASSVNTKNAKRDKHLLTGDFFDVATYPTMTFTATSARATGPGKVELDGEFTVLGQSRAVTVPAAYALAGDTVTIRGELEIDRSHWGMSQVPMGAGLVNHVAISAVFTKSA